MISFSRTPPGLAAEYLFYSEILVYVEGYTDIPFYNEVLQNYSCQIKSKNGKTEVWRSVKTRDHNSLKRRLRKAGREAEKIRQAQSNTSS